MIWLIGVEGYSVICAQAQFVFVVSFNFSQYLSEHFDTYGGKS